MKARTSQSSCATQAVACNSFLNLRLTGWVRMKADVLLTFGALTPKIAQEATKTRDGRASPMNRAIVISMAGLLALATTRDPDRAVALSMEQAMAQCKEQVSPVVRACVRQKMMANHDTSPEPYIPGCRAPVVAQVKACVAKLIGAAGFKHQPLDEATEPTKAPPKAVIVQMPAPPPRTIADITAILDQEKPDPARLKKLQSTADASEPAKSDSVALAHFYFGRSVARSELGRFREAVADGEQAIQVATGKVDQIVLNNFRSTVALQYLLAGEPKSALDVYLKMADANEHSNNKGFLFIAYRQISNIYLMLGDLGRAQAYVQKIESLWRNAALDPGLWRSWRKLACQPRRRERKAIRSAWPTRRRAEFLPTGGTTSSRQYREIRARDDRHSTYSVGTSCGPRTSLYCAGQFAAGPNGGS